MNAQRLRALLTHTEDHPDLLDLTTFGELRPSGDIAADLAGRALLLSRRWELAADSTFRSTGDGREISGWQEIEHEACAALGLTVDDLWGHSDIVPLFSITGREEAVNRLRELVEQADAAVANA